MSHGDEPGTTDDGRAATRRRGAALETAILDAAWEEFLAGGYSQLSMEKVAARARTGKQVLYRRWPNRALLFVAAMRHRLGPTVPQVPDTGDLRGDILAVLRMMVDRWSQLSPNALHGLFADFPDLGPDFFSIMDGVMLEVLRHAESRGELSVDALPPRVVTLPIDLFRYEQIRPRAMDDEGRLTIDRALTTITEIVDDVFLPLVRVHSGRGCPSGHAARPAATDPTGPATDRDSPDPAGLG